MNHSAYGIGDPHIARSIRFQLGMQPFNLQHRCISVDTIQFQPELLGR